MIKLKYNADGLIPAIIQDFRTKDVLMLGYMNAVSLKKTLKTGKACFYSRSRKAFWVKGETSGHVQLVKKIFYDCDRDALLIQVEQRGGACHTGYRTCFFTGLDRKGRSEKVTLKKIFDPKEIYPPSQKSRP